MTWLREAFWRILFVWVRNDFTITLPGDPSIESCSRPAWPRVVALCLAAAVTVAALSWASYYAWVYGSWRGWRGQS